MSKPKHVPSTYAEVLAYADRTQQGINSEKDSVAGYLMQLASVCKDPDHFATGCEAAENDRRAIISKKSADQKLGKADRKAALRLPACWSQPKSDILRGWNDFGMVPKEYGTYYAFMVEKKRISKEKKAAQQGNTGGGDTTHANGATGAKDALRAMDGSITAILFEPLLSRIAKMSGEMQENIAHALEAIVIRFEQVVSDEVETQGDDNALDELEAAQVVGAIIGHEADENRAQA